MEERRKQRVAVVGSGMAGLLVAHLLQHDPRARYEVTVFECGSQPALDGSSVSLNGSSRTVDVPMRAFAGGYYKNLIAMYDWLGVQYHAQRFLFYFSTTTSQPNRPRRNSPADPFKDPEVHFVHSSNNHRIPPIRPSHLGLFQYVVETFYLLFCYTWFTVCCFAIDAKSDETLGNYVKRIRLPRRFMREYLTPLISSVATCSGEDLDNFPASDIINYKVLTTRQPHFVLSQGMREVQRRLIDGVRIVYNARVSKVERVGDCIEVCIAHVSSGPSTQEFDKVVLGVPPNVVGQIVPQVSAQMSRVPTTSVQTAVWALNDYKEDAADQCSLTAGAHADAAQIIHFRTSGISRWTEANHFQSSGVCVSTDPSMTRVIDSAAHSSTFTRVLRNVESRHLINQHVSFLEDSTRPFTDKTRWRNGDNGIWIAGGWAWDGMVLLEGCVVSAMRVTEGLGVEIPWRRSEKGELH